MVLYGGHTSGHENIIQILLNAGADPNAKDAKGLTPREIRGGNCLTMF